MSVRRLAALAAGAVLLVAACSSSGSSSSAEASAGTSAGVSACKATTDAGAVSVKIIDFRYQPRLISAKIGQVITFTNTGSAPHTATVGPNTCTTPTISPGTSNGLVFSVAGQYPLHCTIHSQMSATVEITG